MKKKNSLSRIQSVSKPALGSVALSVLALGAVACSDLGSPKDDGGRADAQPAVQASQSGSRAHSLAPGQNDRMFEVYDHGYNGNSFEVSVDGAVIGVTPANESGSWSRTLSVGKHQLTVRALPGGASPKVSAWISIHSGVTRSISFPEPQGASLQCGFYYPNAGAEDLTGLGKQMAECKMAQGGSVTLDFVVGQAQ